MFSGRQVIVITEAAKQPGNYKRKVNTPIVAIERHRKFIKGNIFTLNAKFFLHILSFI
jgi:hypothetical protein